MIIYFFEFVLLSYLTELCQNFFAKLSSLLTELLLHIEKIPVAPDTRKHIIEKVIKLTPKSISDFNNLISERNFMLG